MKDAGTILRSAVEEEIQRRQVLDETKLGEALGVDWMFKGLPLNQYPSAFECADVEITLRATLAGVVGACPHALAKVNDALALLTLELQGGCQQDRSRNARPAAHELQHVHVKVDEPVPRTGKDLFQSGPEVRKMVGLSVMGAQRGPDAALPVLLGTQRGRNPFVRNALRPCTSREWHRQPRGPVIYFDPVPVLIVLRFELQVVHHDEEIAVGYL